MPTSPFIPSNLIQINQLLLDLLYYFINTYFEMEKASSPQNNYFTLNPVDVFSLDIVFYLKRNVSRFLPSKLCTFLSNSEAESNQLSNIILIKDSTTYSTSSSSNESEEDDNDDCLFGRDINMVMERLGIEHGLSLEGEEVQKKWGSNELCGIFEEEPSLEEVKEAFDVFDQNKDGFIDEGELQRVLIVLGLTRGIDLHECRNMIRAFDLNNDAKIDFNEFVKFMLNTL